MGIIQDFVRIARIIFGISLSFKERAGVRMGFLPLSLNPSPPAPHPRSGRAELKDHFPCSLQ
jgi:hypothetical protein